VIGEPTSQELPRVHPTFTIEVSDGGDRRAGSRVGDRDRYARDMPDGEVFGASALRKTLLTFRDAMKSHQEGINQLNVYPVPDGDTGTNMARTLDAVATELGGASEDIGPTCDAISHGSLMGARGNSGVILSQILRGLSSSLRSVHSVGGRQLAEALSSASSAAYSAVLKPIEGTILTVVRESAEAATAAADAGEGVVAVLRRAREAGRDALRRTPDLLPVLKEAGVVDAGGAGFLLFYDSALHVLEGEPLPEPTVASGPSAETIEHLLHRDGVDASLDVSALRYEVMFLLHLNDDRKQEFMSAWGAIGDSIVVVGGEGLYNCHVHTNDIGAAIEVPLELEGRPFRIRVTDLFEEVAEEHAEREAAMATSMSPSLDASTARSGAVSTLPAVGCAVIAVCAGDGLAGLFAQMGVQGVVTGGQTMNPSTAELLDAVGHVNAPDVVILPNNKNIIPVANQVDALSDKRVRVVPTNSMPEALAALVVYDPEADADANAAAMTAAAEAVETGEVTTAVRDTTVAAGPIKAGEFIGLVRGDGIVATSGSLTACATAVVDHLIAPGRELVTVIFGDGVSSADVEAVVGHVRTAGLDVEVHDGGQPLYPFLFGAE